MRQSNGEKGTWTSRFPFTVNRRGRVCHVEARLAGGKGPGAPGSRQGSTTCQRLCCSLGSAPTRPYTLKTSVFLPSSLNPRGPAVSGVACPATSLTGGPRREW